MPYYYLKERRFLNKKIHLIWNFRCFSVHYIIVIINNFAIALSNFFDKVNYDVEVVVYKNAVERFDSTLHNREKCNKIAFQVMENSGIRLVRGRKSRKN